MNDIVTADYVPSEDEPFMNERQKSYFRQKLITWKNDSALQRIDEGTYGYCEETGEPIALKRLDARPIATLSIEAQERHERREKVYRDD
ncbi:MAG: TraR/DksA family transcriptional regulator [Mesorhizobium sp.]|nr:MAG: TraR/DksA family transcriptional regulator [Mesorhizobium sp.]